MSLLFKYYLYTLADLIYEFISQHAFDFFQGFPTIRT